MSRLDRAETKLRYPRTPDIECCECADATRTPNGGSCKHANAGHELPCGKEKPDETLSQLRLRA